MTRNEIRELAQEALAHYRITHITIPDPEPECWDYFPHLEPMMDRRVVGSWSRVWEGTRTATVCEGCGQMVWEYETLWQALIYVQGLEYYIGFTDFCLPCHKALNLQPNVIVDDGYELTLAWNYDDIVPSAGVFTDEYWYTHAKPNYSAEDVHALKTGATTHEQIWVQRIKRRSEF